MTLRLQRQLRRLGSAGPGGRPPAVVDVPPVPRSAGDDVGPAPDPARQARLARLRSLIATTLARPRTAPAPSFPVEQGDPTLPGHVQETAVGPLRVLDRWFEPGHHHGRVSVADALTVDSSSLAALALDPELRGVDARRLLFLDTETTGLAGGTGTLPFLVGLGWFEDESLRVEQLLVPRPGDEGPMLHRLAERVAAAGALVTFNGKAYDWPLLRTRAVLGRVPLPTPPAHLDLLHCARRVYKARLTEGVRLVQIEDEVLGLCREHDVAGREIPGLYFDFLRGLRPASCLGPVLEHNALDLLALAALVARLGHDYGAAELREDPRDALGYATVARRAGDPVRAVGFARLAADGGLSCPDAAHAAHWLVADLARKRGDIGEERTALEAALASARGDRRRAAAHLALAKHLEHRARDLDAALRHAAHTVPAETSAARDRRVARLERRRSRNRTLAGGSSRPSQERLG